MNVGHEMGAISCRENIFALCRYQSQPPSDGLGGNRAYGPVVNYVGGGGGYKMGKPRVQMIFACSPLETGQADYAPPLFERGGGFVHPPSTWLIMA